MSTIRAVVVEPGAPGRLAVREVPEPVPARGEALVAMRATSLNPGEVQVAQQAPPGWRPGRDVAGVVLEQAADGSGPAAGTRVVGIRDEPGVWAERVAVPAPSLAALPDGVSFARAAALPVAGLTALHALAKGGMLLGRRVLVTGSTGGVGLFAHRLAAIGGAASVGSVRRADDVARVQEAGAEAVVVGDLGRAAEHGPFDLVVESLGGDAFGTALGLLAPGGVCVNIGWSAAPTAVVDVAAFNRTGGASAYGLRLDTELRGRPAGRDLAVLARFVADGRLRVPVEVEASWHRVGEVADDLLQRRFKGKAVLHLDDARGGPGR